MKAKRQTIALGDLELDVFQLPDGEYVVTNPWLKRGGLSQSGLKGNERLGQLEPMFSTYFRLLP
jgi:hypothetical protein